MTIADLRKEYTQGGLNESEVSPDPFVQFGRWFAQLLEVTRLEPNAMTLATATADGRPSARIVLLKGFDERGFIFYTNYSSRKGGEIAANPWAALLFYWPELERQVRVEGVAAPIDADAVEAYFHSRPREAQLGAWASRQSEVVASRAELEASYQATEERFDGQDVPVPPTWGGYRVRPESFEFWQGRSGRMHDRLLYRRNDAGWQRLRLAP